MNRSRLVGPLLVALLLLTAPAEAGAQNATTGAIRGRVTTADGGFAAAAQVTATNLATGFIRGALAGDDGRYQLLLLPPGTYTVRAQRIGMRPAVADSIRVRLNEASTVDLRLQSSAVTLEEVAVTGARELQVDTKQTGVAEFVGEREIENLPTLGRDFTDFIALSGLVSPQPEVSTGGTFAIGGGRTSGVNVQIDGADANLGFFGESRGGARIPFTFSLQSIREFQVITNGYDVEFGNYSSGIVNVVTQGGTNEFHGGLQATVRSNRLANRDFLQTVPRFSSTGAESTTVTLGGRRPREYDVRQYSLNLSGPILRDKLHYLVSYDGQRRTDPFDAISPEGTGVPQATIEEFTSILETVYGQRNARNEMGYFDKTDNVDVLFGRLDWTASPSHRLSLRANYADYAAENDGLQFGGNRARTFGSVFADRNLSVVGELNSVLGAQTFNVFRVQFAEEKRPRTSNNFLPLAVVNVTTSRRLEYGGSGITYRNRLRESKVQIVDNLTINRGDHTFKLGTNNLFTEIYNKFWLFGNGQFTFASLDDFRNRRPSQYTRLIPEAGPRAPETTFRVFEFSAYGQDEWQVTDKLVGTLGVRWDMSRYPTEFASVRRVDTLPAIGLKTGSSPEDLGNFSPRASLAYDLFGDQQHVVRAGVGYFFGRVPAVLGSNVGTGSNPYLSLNCQGFDALGVPRAPDPAYESFDPSGDANPATCRSGGALAGDREYTFWGESFEYPQTFKASLGYEGRVGTGTRFGVDLLFGRSSNQFTTRDLALRAAPGRFATGEGNRPIYVAGPLSTWSLFGANPAARSRYAGISRIYVHESKGVGDELAATLRADQRFSWATLRASYTYNWAKDNSSVVCCTAFENLFQDATSGPLNDRGGRGGSEWGNSRFVRPHTIVVSGESDLPFGINVSGILRANSGTFYTPSVFGDLNADGNPTNDRPFIGRSDQILFDRPVDRVAYERLLADNECLSDAVGGIIGRNTCENPWITQLDMSLKKGFGLGGDREIEVIADFFNVLNALNKDWGRWRRVGEQQLLSARRFDGTTGKFVYQVNQNFGQPTFIGPVRQFQTQLGARLRF